MKTILLTLLTLLSSTLVSAIPSTIDVGQNPTIGDPQAPVQVVAFLEPKCPDSKRYHDTAFPKLKTDFIDTKKVRYSVIITSFLSQSMPAAVGLLCVYNQDPNKPNSELFFKFLDYIYKNQPPESKNWATIDTVLKFAKNASSEIKLDRLKNCIEKEDYKTQVEKNTAYGNKLMGHLSTPSIYVNGIKLESDDDNIEYDKLKSAIQQALQKNKT
jgi:protein-disulfide isomerase